MARIDFSLFVVPSARDAHAPVRLAEVAEVAGFDYVSIQDHPYNSTFHETWTLLTWIAARTERIKLYPNVANLPLRPPAMLAKAAASLDRLSGGRVELGLGAGAFWDAIAAMGGPRRTPAEALAALEEAIRVSRAVWSDQRSVRFDGEHYRLQGYRPGPAPAHPIGIWLGVTGPKALALTGRLADGWSVSLGYVPLERLREGQARIDAAAREAGRDPGAIRRTLNLQVDLREPGLVERLADLVLSERFDLLNLSTAGDPFEAVPVLGAEVLPRVREEVAGSP